MSLNPAQQTAVETLSNPLLVLAGAGTGKTRVVTYRIARLIKNGIRPSRILAVTFTNKAAKEMQTRVTEVLGNRNSAQKGKRERPEVSTFHSLCVRILRRHIDRLGYPKQFAIYDRGDQETLARQALKEIKISNTALKPGDLIAKISGWKCQSLSPDEAAAESWAAKDHLAALAYDRYQKALKTKGAVDFDDLLLKTEELFKKFPDVLKLESERFDHLLIDEYQDTNGSQYRIVRGLALPHRNICVVGDDDQAIYGWRGAEVSHILNFRRDWPDAKIVRLETNYRSTKQIIDWANQIIAFNKQRHDKKLRTEKMGEPPRILQCKDGETEAKTVVEQIRERLAESKRQPRDFAVLFRTNDQPRAFEMEFRLAKVPYVLIGGQSFFDKKEVRDVLAYLKTAMRPRDDVSLLRILNTPPRGIGSTSIQKLTENAVSQGKSVWDAISAPEIIGQIVGKSRESLEAFRNLISEYSHKFQNHFSLDNINDFIDAIGYRHEIERNYLDPEERSARWESVGEILNTAAAYIQDENEPTLVGFLDQTSLAGPDFSAENKSELQKNAVVLMTLHAAKGLEFKEVYMVGLEEGILPHHRSVSSDDILAVDEERRLCYVGVTRAQLRLTLTLALARRKWGEMRPTIPSRFLYEITGQADNPNYQKTVEQQSPKNEKKRR
ncbi:MAG: UvrD-helicase domain-containing protein [Planctomycetaceae bacterium]|jgi:DNA helicase-2/ATP-dependent DNA helicase PcrA|nr:UvrD-helicase domain-containing protein [Planctomycetaceae bacterium]